MRQIEDAHARRHLTLRRLTGRQYAQWEDAMARIGIPEKIALTSQAALDAHRAGDLDDTYKLLQAATAALGELARTVDDSEKHEVRHLTTLSNGTALKVGMAKLDGTMEARESAAIVVQHWKVRMQPYLELLRWTNER